MLTKRSPAHLALASLALALVAACGGNVVVDRGGATATTTGTTGSGGGTTTTTGTTTTGTTTTGTTTGTTTADLCTEMCTVLVQNGCQPGSVADCVPQCTDSFVQAGACAPQLDAVYQCYKPSLAQCPKDPPPQCNGELQAYAMCAQGGGGGCSSEDCSGSVGPGGETGCDCQQTCNGKPLEASCTTKQGQTVCSCLVGGNQVGTCSGSGPKDPCSLQSGCCAQFFQ